MSGDQKHQYHLVEPSPWPALGSAAGFTLFLGLTLFMHEYPYSIYVLGAGLFMVLATMFYWWRDVIREAEYQGHHTPIVQIGMRYGMIFFICSEVMFFVAFFWAFFDSSLYPDTGVWPPADIVALDPFDLPLINTLISSPGSTFNTVILSCWVVELKFLAKVFGKPMNPTVAGIWAPWAPVTLYWISMMFEVLQTSWLSVSAAEINSNVGPSKIVIVPPPTAEEHSVPGVIIV